MLFGSSTIHHLIADHRRIKEFLATILNHKQDHPSKKQAFTKLLPLFISHNHREEKVIYAFMALQGEDLRQMAIEGDEEHALLDGLVEELLHDYSLTTEEWTAKVEIFAELLFHHLDDEERIMFPKLKKVLTGELDEKLCAEYDGRSARHAPSLPSVLHLLLITLGGPMNSFTIGTMAIACALAFSIRVAAEESLIEKSETSVNKATDSVTENYRDAKDKGCEMINGKMHCAGQKVKNKTKTLMDKTETKVEETKNKVD